MEQWVVWMMLIGGIGNKGVIKMNEVLKVGRKDRKMRGSVWMLGRGLRFGC